MSKAPHVGNDLVALIRTRKAEIARLQAELDAARAALADEQSDATVYVSTRARHKRPARLTGQKRRRRGDSTTAWAEAVLRDAGKNLHITQLLKGIEDRFHKKVLKTTLVGNLARKVKARDTFDRPAPSTFGLLEWRNERAIKLRA